MFGALIQHITPEYECSFSIANGVTWDISWQSASV